MASLHERVQGMMQRVRELESASHAGASRRPPAASRAAGPIGGGGAIGAPRSLAGSHQRSQRERSRSPRWGGSGPPQPRRAPLSGGGAIGAPRGIGGGGRSAGSSLPPPPAPPQTARGGLASHAGGGGGGGRIKPLTASQPPAKHSGGSKGKGKRGDARHPAVGAALHHRGATEEEHRLRRLLKLLQRNEGLTPPKEIFTRWNTFCEEHAPRRKGGQATCDPKNLHGELILSFLAGLDRSFWVNLIKKVQAKGKDDGLDKAWDDYCDQYAPRRDGQRVAIRDPRHLGPEHLVSFLGATLEQGEQGQALAALVDEYTFEFKAAAGGGQASAARRPRRPRRRGGAGAAAAATTQEEEEAAQDEEAELASQAQEEGLSPASPLLHFDDVDQMEEEQQLQLDELEQADSTEALADDGFGLD